MERQKIKNTSNLPTYLKYALLTTNSIALVIGILACIYAIFWIMQEIIYRDIYGQLPTLIETLTLGMGLITIVLNSFTYYGVLKEVMWILDTIDDLQLIMALINIGIASYTFVVLCLLKNEQTEYNLNEMFRKNRATFHKIETMFNCCGVKSYKNYETIPRSCCSVDNNKYTCVNPHLIGCSNAVQESYERIIKICGSLFITLALIQIINSVLIVLLRRNIPRDVV